MSSHAMDLTAELQFFFFFFAVRDTVTWDIIVVCNLRWSRIQKLSGLAWEKVIRCGAFYLLTMLWYLCANIIII